MAIDDEAEEEVYDEDDVKLFGGGEMVLYEDDEGVGDGYHGFLTFGGMDKSG
jgi:hypothetical protein